MGEMGNWDGNKGSPSRLSSGFDEGRRTGNFARTLEGFQALYSVPQGARCKVCEREGVRATRCRVVGAAGRAARKRPNVRAWGALGKGRNLEGKPWKGPHPWIHPSGVGAEPVGAMWVCNPPPSGGGSQSEAPSGVGIAARTGKVQSQREPGRVLTGPSRGAPGFSPSSRKTVEHATAHQRPRLARAPPACSPAGPRRARRNGARAPAQCWMFHPRIQ